jgi:mercuric ion transport protein
VELSPGVESGDLVECPNCAGHALRVREERGRWSATLAYRVSCPECDEVITLPENAKVGDAVSCCRQTYTLTFEFGAFAAEKTWEATMWRDRWLALGVMGVALACLSCVTPLAVVALGAIGLGAWAGRLDIVILPVLGALIALVIYRYRVACRRAG